MKEPVLVMGYLALIAFAALLLVAVTTPAPIVPKVAPHATVCITDSEVLTPPKGSSGMRLKTTTTCK